MPNLNIPLIGDVSLNDPSTPPETTSTAADDTNPTSPSQATRCRDRPTAADFFDSPPLHSQEPPPDVRTPPAPSVQDLPPENELPSAPPRPQHLPGCLNTNVQHCDTLGSPIEIGPSEEALPTADVTTDLHAFRSKWLAIFDEDLDWPTFSAHCEDYAREGRQLAQSIATHRRPRPAPRRPKRPSARPPVDNRRITVADPVAARRIQQLYRLSKKLAARKILGDDSPNFTGSTDDAFNIFSSSFGQRDCNTDALKEELKSFVPTTETDESLFDPPTPEELQQKLRSLTNSAPGKDRLEYRHIRMIDSKCEILARIYSFCFSS